MLGRNVDDSAVGEMKRISNICLFGNRVTDGILANSSHLLLLRAREMKFAKFRETHHRGALILSSFETSSLRLTVRRVDSNSLNGSGSSLRISGALSQES